MRFDAMCAVTGPLRDRNSGKPPGSGAKGTVTHGTPLPDFGGMHPDPNPTWAHELMGRDDGGRMPPILVPPLTATGTAIWWWGAGFMFHPRTVWRCLAANAHLAPGYRAGLKGVARSMPTSAAVDRVAAALGIASHETPTGWKFFGNLLDAGKVTICGEESFGTGSDHVREKDGLWAVLLWLNILAKRDDSVSEILGSDTGGSTGATTIRVMITRLCRPIRPKR